MDRAAWMELVKDWALALGIMAAVLVGWRLMQPDELTGGDAPPLVLPMPDGDTWDLAAQGADVVVVNFWATWCGPCRQEIPELTAFAASHPEVALVGVSVDEAFNTEALGTAARRLGVRYPVAHDRSGAVARAWGVTSYPTTFVLDAHRHVVARHLGTLDRIALRQLVARAEDHP